MPGLRPDVDPDGLREFSVVYSDRSLNHMSACFQQVMRDLSEGLREVYRANAVVIVPGSGTFAMEAVARQFATDQRCLILRNGWFSYRWSQIFEKGRIPKEALVLKARPLSTKSSQVPYTPAPLAEVLHTIDTEKPQVVCAAHVETSAGMRLTEEYIRAVAGAVHNYGGLLVLDCIASGCDWVDMEALGVDVLLSAPQKGWSSTPCCGLVMLSAAATTRLEETQSTSFACDLKQWRQIMLAYEQGKHAYHATMPTDGLKRLRETLAEMRALGFESLKQNQLNLGKKVRALLADYGFISVAADGFEASGVVVCFAPDDIWRSGAPFKSLGIQVAAGVPLQCDESDNFKSFRLGLFGIEKLVAVDDTVAVISKALETLKST
jgi:aspartate aminotransferase-like enzyme